MPRFLGCAAVAIVAVALGCEHSVKDPWGGGPQRTGGATQAGTGGSTGQSGGDTGSHGGMGGAGGTNTLALCAGPRVDPWGSARPPVPEEPTASVRVIRRQDCQPFSGCKTFAVFRDAATDRLISAVYDHDPATLPAFAEALGVPLTLEPTCSFPPQTNCYIDEVQTLYRLVVGAEIPATVDRRSSATVAIDGHSFAVSLGDAVGARGAGFAPSACLDAAGFWASGAVHMTVVAKAP